MSPRWRKVLRDLWYNKTRTGLVVLSIAVGVMGIGMISGSRVILARDMQVAYLETDPFHAILFPDNFDPELVDAIRRMPEVADAEGRRDVRVRVQTGPDEWQDLQLVAIDNFSDIRINRIWHLEGAQSPRKRELLIERASLTYLEAAVGDSLAIRVRDGEDRALRIAGTVHDVNEETPIFSGQTKGYITFETLEALGWSRDLDQLMITVAEKGDDREHIRAVTEMVRRKIEKSGLTVYGEWVPTPGEHWAHEDVQSMLFLLSAMGVLSLLLSGLLVVNTVSALLTQQVQQIGVMKTIGANEGQLAGIYLTTVLMYGTLSLLVAVPLGALGAQALTTYIGSLLNFDIISFDIDPGVLGLETSIGLLAPVLAAAVPVWQGTQISVREAIGSYGLGKGQYGSSRFDQLLNRVRGLSRPNLLSLRNTFRRKARLALVVVTLTVASAIFISVLSVKASLLLTLDDALRYWNYDVRVNFGRSYRIEALESEALSIPGVARAEGWGFWNAVRMRSDDEQSADILMIAPPLDSQFIDPLLLDGRWLLPEDENALVINQETLQEEPDLAVGSEMILRIDQRDTSWRVVGIVNQPLSGPFVYLNYPAFSRATRNVGRVTNLRIAGDADSTRSQAELAKQLEDRLKAQGFQVSSTRTTDQERTESENSLNIIVTFLLIMAVLLAVVGGLGLMGTMSINVLERTREVGVMRAIGASDGSILQIILIEGTLIGILSWLLGALLSLPLGKVLSDQVGMLFLGAPPSYIFSIGGAFLWLAVMMGYRRWQASCLPGMLRAWPCARR